MTCGSHAVFLPPHEAPRETQQACFLLKLQPSLPVMLTFVTKLQKLTGGEDFCGDSFHQALKKWSWWCWWKKRLFCVWCIDVIIPEVNQQMAPLPHLLLNVSARVKCQEEMEEPDAYFTVVCVLFTHTFHVELLCTQCQVKWLKSLVFAASCQWRNSQICVPWSCLGGPCSERDVIGQCSFHSSRSDSCHVGATEASVHNKHPADDLRHFSACRSR